MLGIGLVFCRQASFLKDYFLGGRRLNRWVTALSAQASDMSGWLMLGLPGLSYLAGAKLFHAVFDIPYLAGLLIGAAGGPVVLAALFWRRTPLKGAAAGMIIGGLTGLIWKPLSGGLFDLYELRPGFVFWLLAIAGVGLLDTPPAPETIAEFDEVRTEA